MKNTLNLLLAFALMVSLSTIARAQGALSAVQFIDATTVAASGPNGSILRSTDAGITWYNQSSGYSNFLGGLAFSSASAGIVVGGDPIAGTQEILRTTNGGSTWSPQPTVNAQTLVSASLVDANNGFAVGYSGTVLNTTNGGANWVSRSLNTFSSFHGVSFTDPNSGTVVGDFGLIVRTGDAGVSWAVQSSGTSNTLYAVDFQSSSTGTVVGAGGFILRTADGGSSWTRQTAGTSNNLNAVNFVDANTGWAVGNNGTILHTANGGSSWSAQSVPIVHYYGVSFRDGNTGVAVGSNTILRTTNGGASWTQQSVGTSSPPGAFNLLSPADVSTSQPQSGTLSWQSSSNAASYDVYMSGSNPPVTVVSSNQAGTSYLYSGLASGATYYWKVVAKNSSGSITASGAPWSFSTAASGPTMPTVATDAATSILSGSAISNGSVNPNGAATTSWFEWGTSSTLLTYTSTGSQAIGSGSLPVAFSSTLSGLTPSATYYFRAAGQNGSGTQRGGILSFTALPLAPPVPTLSSPANNAIDQPTTVTLIWNTSTGATSYHAQVSTSSTFSTLFLDDATLTTTSRLVSGLSNSTLYYWRVNASNIGGASAYSGAFNLTTASAPPQPPPAPVLASPANGATKQSTSPTLTWNASAGATSYRVQVSSNSQFSTFVVDNSTLTTTSQVVGPLAGGTNYYWRANATNSAGSSGWSATSSFKTVNGGGPKGIASATEINSGSLIIPKTYELKQNYPNPFNPTTTIGFTLATSSIVTLRVMNILGQEVATLIQNQVLNAGPQFARFDATHLASGIYIYRIDATSVSDPNSTFTQIRKMLLVR